MIRIALLVSCLASCVGCAASRKVTDGNPVGVSGATTPKEYDYKDLSAGSSGISRR